MLQVSNFQQVKYSNQLQSRQNQPSFNANIIIANKKDFLNSLKGDKLSAEVKRGLATFLSEAFEEARKIASFAVPECPDFFLHFDLSQNIARLLHKSSECTLRDITKPETIEANTDRIYVFVTRHVTAAQDNQSTTQALNEALKSFKD